MVQASPIHQSSPLYIPPTRTTHMKPEGIAFLEMKAGLLTHETEVYSNTGTQQKNSWKQAKCTLHIKIPFEECKKH